MGGLISSIGTLFGGAPSFQAQSANIQNPVNSAQANSAITQAGSGLDQQQALINALGSQNGIQNQSDVYNQLQGVANGTGPNPALAQLNQTTAANVGNQAALMAGQRGAGANVGLEARQAAQQGANTQQQAVGQAATLEAQQQLGALGQLGGIAGQQVGEQTGAVNNYTSSAQAQQQALLNAIAQQNSANVANTSNMNSTNAGVANNSANNAANAIGGLASGISGVGSLLAQPAKTPATATTPVATAFGGGSIENPKLRNVPEKDRFENNLTPSHIKQMKDFYHGTNFKGGGKVPGKAEMKGDHPKNDTVPAMLSPGEFVIPKSVMESENPIQGAGKMIAEFMKKNGGHHKKESDFKTALKKAMSERRAK